MKREQRIHAGLFLTGLGVVYLIWFSPGLPAWGWALLGAVLFFALAKLRGVYAAAGYGALFLGWSLGAIATDLTGLQSLKLVGTGLGLALWGLLERVSWVAWLGAALAVAGVLVFLWEAPLGGWVALILLAVGLYLALREPAGPSQQEPEAASERLQAILDWRTREALRRGVINTEIISDEEVGCLAELPEEAGMDRLAACLNGDEERARLLWSYLME
ncbi:hypothetical protein [Oceanithermus sp.]